MNDIEALITEMESAGESAMQTLNIGPHESMAWEAVEAPFYDLLRMVREGWTYHEISNEYWGNTNFYQYAAFNAAYDVYCKRTKKED